MIFLNPSVITSPPASHPSIAVVYKKWTASQSQQRAFVMASCQPHCLNFWHSPPTVITPPSPETIPSAPKTWYSVSCIDLRIKNQHVDSSSIYWDSKSAWTTCYQRPEEVAICSWSCSFCCNAAATAGKSLQSCPTLCDPMDCSPPDSSVHGIFQARVLEWGAICCNREELIGPHRAYL